MGCGQTVTCLTCKVHHDCGYGSYSTWILGSTPKEFRENAARKPSDLELTKNQELLAALTRHAGHRIVIWSEDYAGFYKGDLRICGHWDPDTTYTGAESWPFVYVAAGRVHGRDQRRRKRAAKRIMREHRRAINRHLCRKPGFPFATWWAQRYRAPADSGLKG